MGTFDRLANKPTERLGAMYCESRDEGGSNVRGQPNAFKNLDLNKSLLARS